MDHIKQVEHGDTLRSPYLWGLKMKIKKLSSKDIKISLILLDVQARQLWKNNMKIMALRCVQCNCAD